MTTAQHPTSYPWASTVASFSAARHQSYIKNKCNRNIRFCLIREKLGRKKLDDFKDWMIWLWVGDIKNGLTRKTDASILLCVCCLYVRSPFEFWGSDLFLVKSTAEEILDVHADKYWGNQLLGNSQLSSWFLNPICQPSSFMSQRKLLQRKNLSLTM